MSANDATQFQSAGATEYQPPGETVAAPEEGRVARQVAEAQVAQEWNVGDVILDTYEVTGLLGEGGMGKVYKVHHRSWNVDLAVKCPHPHIFAQAGGAENFGREAETWVNLGLHPHIVSCHYVRTLGGIPRVFAEYVKGGSLSDWIRDRKLTALDQILDVAIQFAWGLHYAHEQGLVHQDVKPANVMMTPEGLAQVTDFGLARARAMVEGATVEASAGRSVIVPGAGLMTREYASPEQAAGRPLTRRTDTWSWGASVLEMFAGECFWRWGPAVEESLDSYLEQWTEAGLPQMPEQVVVLLRQCFREDPAERPRDILEAVAVLQEVYQQQVGRPYSRKVPQAVELRADSLNNRALSLLDLGQAEKAMAAWEEALQLDALHTESVYNQGLLQWRRAQITDVALLERMDGVSASHPGEWEVPYLLGQVHLERGDGAAATEALSGIQKPEAGRREVAAALALAKENEAARRLLRTFEGHTHGVGCVYLSADGHYALSGSGDQTLKLWEVESGRCLRTFEGHTSNVNSVSLSADGRYALSGSADKTLKLWEVESGRCLHTFGGHTDSVRSVCLSADGRYALSGSWDHTLKLWEVVSGRCLRTFGGHRDLVHSVCLSADGRYALSGSRDKTLKLWDAARWRCLRICRGHTGHVHSVCLSADGRYALSGSGDKTLKLWDVVSGRCLRTFEGHKDSVNSVCLSADGRYALSGSEDMKLWEVASGRCLRTFEGHMLSVRSVCLSADGRYALSGSADDTLKLWEVRLGSNPPAAPFMLSQARAVQEAFSSQAAFAQALAQARQALERGQVVEAAKRLRQALAQPGFARADPALELWYRLYTCLPRASLRGGWEAATFEGHTKDVNSVCLSADGRYALSGGWDKTLKLWEVESGRCLRTFEGHKSTVYSVCLSADGRYALSGSLDHKLKLWEVATGECLRTFKGHPSPVESVYLSADGRYALSGGWNETLKLWEVESGRCLRTFEGHKSTVYSVCLSADGRYALSGSADKTLKLWEVESGRCLHTFGGHTDSVRSVCLSADGRYALSGSGDQTLKLWEVESGRCLRTFEGHTNGVISVCLSVDGRYALSGSYDKTLKLWEVESGRCLHTFGGHTDSVRSVCLSADGRYALSGSVDKTLKLRALDWELEDQEPADWDEGARPHLENFRTLHTPSAAKLPANRQPSEEEITLALTRRGEPTWTEEDFQQLLYTLGCTGYGWLRPGGVRQELVKRAEAISREESPKHDEGKRQIMAARAALAENQLAKARAALRKALSLQGYERDVKLLEDWHGCGLRAGRRVGLFSECHLHTFEGHTNRVSSVCLSADGRYALSGGWDNTLKLWDAASERCVRTFEGHKDLVESVCLSADGRYALSGSRDETLMLWEVESGHWLRTFEGHTSYVLSVCLSSDGRYALSGSLDKTLKLWDIASGRCLRTFKGQHKGGVFSVCLSTDGRYALSGSNDDTLKLWEVASGRCLRTFEGHKHTMRSAYLSADGRHALSYTGAGTGLYSAGKTFELWEVETGRCVRTFEGHKGQVNSVCLSADGRYALSGSEDKTLKLWEVASGRCLCTFEGHKGQVNSVYLSADGRYVLSGSEDKTLKLWELTWDYEFPETADWDEGVRPYLETFLTLHTPPGRSLFRRPKSEWTEEDFQKLLTELQYRGYGWLRPDGVRRELDKMAAQRG